MNSFTGFLAKTFLGKSTEGDLNADEAARLDEAANAASMDPHVLDEVKEMAYKPPEA